MSCKYRFECEENKDKVIMERDFTDYEEIYNVVTMFVQFLIANEFSIDLISQHIDLTVLGAEFVKEVARSDTNTIN